MTTKNTKTSSLAQENAVETTVRLAAIQQIAREELDIETLDARHSDQLDFHDLPVWQIRKALLKAYEAGLRRIRG
ncbi:MAG: hypothetical protein DCC67_07630 [Planctomycetota bacterium]|nr:MAG: hypothetical protein DCC67_07630 [Planctomycetota bacterium]